MIDYRPDHAGVATILHSYSGDVTGLAQRIAGNVRALHPDADIVVDSYRTDRSAASVTIRDPRAMLWQVRDGVLTRAAASAGLEVRAR